MRRTLASALTLVLLLQAGSAAGEEASPSNELARQHYATGTTYYKVSDFPRALEEFTKAYRAQPLPALLFNIGRCHEVMAHLEDAIRFYRLYLEKAPAASDRALVEAKIRNMQERLAAQKGSASPASSPASGPVSPITPGEPRRISWRGITGWVALGAGAASLIAGVALGAAVKSKSDQYQEGAAPGGRLTYGELEQLASDGERLQTAHRVTLIAGGVVAAAGVALLIWEAVASRDGREQSASQTAIQVTPLVGPGAFGLAGAARF